MPLLPRRLRSKPRLEALFFAAVGCLVLTFTMLNVGDKPLAQAPHSFQSSVGVDKPSIRYGPYRSGNDKRVLGKKASSPSESRNDGVEENSRQVANAVSMAQKSIISAENITDAVETEKPPEHVIALASKATGLVVQSSDAVVNATSPVQVATQSAGKVTSAVQKRVSLVNNKTEDNEKVTGNGASESAKISGGGGPVENEAKPVKVVEHHTPDYFLRHVPLENLIRRGNILTAHSGCSIATWSYNGKRHASRPLNECRQHAKSGLVFAKHRVTPENATQVQPYDSIYVPMIKLEHFVNETMPHIQNPFVLITGQASLQERPIPRHVYDAVLANPRVLRWFLQNLSKYAYDPSHAKLSPFPYGTAAQRSATVLAEIQKSVRAPKDYLLYSPPQTRKRNQLEQEEVYSKIQNSRYILSPSESRPETHQQYEAIGFGTKPITSLDPHLHRHLEGNVIFGEQKWNLTEMEEDLPQHPSVNRRLAFEEYWMEYVEREVGHPMRWWDPSSDERRSLPDITERVRRAVGGKQEEAKVAMTTKESKGVHYPTYFKHEAPLDKLIDRGNLLRVFTGCSIATWSYSGWTSEDDQKLDDCYHDKGEEALLMHQVTNETTSLVQPYDSIYVPIASLERFVTNVLPKIQVDFILMSGQKSLLPPFSRDLFDKVIEHPRVIHWFLQNQAVYSYDPHHPKMGIFPYGIFTKYPENYLAEMKRDVEKDNFIYVGYLNKGTNRKVRKDIPRQRHKILPPIYFSGMRNSTYVLSPDGDRPECHRHYEAIGLGTMPITGLDPYLHRHLLGNAIYGERRWKLDELEKKLPRDPKVNRRLVFEEYWMEYIEQEMGRPLRWWDPSRNLRCSLQEIVNLVKSS